MQVRLTAVQREALSFTLKMTGYPPLETLALRRTPDGAQRHGDSWYDREQVIDWLDKIDGTRTWWASTRRALRQVYLKCHDTKPPAWLAPPRGSRANTLPHPDGAPADDPAGPGADTPDGAPRVGPEH
jgi:hypothetical protein